MKSLLIASAFVWTTAATAQSSAGFAQHSAKDLADKEREIVRNAQGNKPSVAVLGKTSATVSALIHRAATGEAEFHENMADFFVVRSGHGTLVVGGQLKDSRRVAPGEMAAVAIDGGERRAIGPGDVIYIPAKLPHHVLVDRGEPLSYLIIKAKE